MIAALSIWVVPLILLGIPLYGYLKGVNVYEAFVEGASEGVQMAVRIFPYLVAIFLALSLFRASGALAATIHFLDPVLRPLGVPGEVIPLVIVRPLSGNAALGILTDLLKHHGPDSTVGRLASIMQGSTDTTLYILTLYFGSVGIRKSRYALYVGLLGDLVGAIFAVVMTTVFFGH